MKRINLLVIVILYLCIQAYPSYGDCYRCKGNYCILESMLSACDRLGAGVERQDIEQLITHKSVEDDLTKLHSVARHLGIHSTQIKLKPEEILLLNTPVIAQLWDGHMVLVENTSSDRIKIIDPIQDTRIMTTNEFANIYSGLALALAKSEAELPIAKKDVPDLRVQSYIADFGEVYPNTVIDTHISLWNTGTKELTLKNARGTCGCTPVLLSEKTIPPGKQTDMKITIDMTGREGSQDHKVYIHSNDPVTPIVQVRLVGTVISQKLLMYPRGVDFGILRKGESPSREIHVYDSGGKDFKVIDAVSSSPHIRASLNHLREGDRDRCIIAVSLTPDLPLGEFRGALKIITNHPIEPEAEIPISAVVKDKLTSDSASIISPVKRPRIPSMQVFFDGIKQGLEASRNVTITSPSGKSFEIEKIENRLKPVSVEVNPLNENTQYNVTITLAKDIPPGVIAGDIIIHTNDMDQSKIKIKVYARISSK